VAVKLLLDRKEEHLGHGQPSVRRSRRFRAGVSADGQAHGVRRTELGHGAARARRSNFPLPYIYQFPNRRRVHTDVYINAGQQRAMRAPGHPQGCFLTEILMDELADRVRMEFRSSSASRIFRRAAAERGVGRLLHAGREGVSGGEKTPCDWRSDAGPDQERLRRIGPPVGVAGGRGGPRPLRHHLRRQRRDEGRHSGPRHGGREQSSRCSQPKPLGLAGQRREAGNRRHDVSGVRRVGRAATTGRVDQPGDPASPRAGARDQGLRQGGPRSWASAPTMLVAEGGRILRQRQTRRRA